MSEQMNLIPIDPATVPLKDQIAEAERELAIRERCFPVWVSKGKMQPQGAAQKIASMRAIIATLRRLTATTALVLLAATSSHAAEPIRGYATVTDGDTLKVAGIKIRLGGLASPEISERGGREAKSALADHVSGRIVVCYPDGTRTYDRIVATCEVDGRDVAAFLVESGVARDCPRFSRGRYAVFETSASLTLPLPGYCLRR
jgi:endonuclease YncB( thermonuclease family)